MSKWDDLSALFLKEHAETGIGPREFCESNSINYATARRYIKLPQANLKKPPKAKERKTKEGRQKPGVKPGSRNLHLAKHGGYTKYFNNDINELVEATSLEDELDLCRARIHLVMDAIHGIQKLLDDPDTNNEARTRLYESMFKAENALDRNVQRVESIIKTLSSLETDTLARGKLIAETSRIKQQTQALVNATKRGKYQAEISEHEAAKARKEAGGTSKLDDFIDKRTGGLDTVVSQ